MFACTLVKKNGKKVSESIDIVLKCSPSQKNELIGKSDCSIVQNTYLIVRNHRNTYQLHTQYKDLYFLLEINVYRNYVCYIMPFL